MKRLCRYQFSPLRRLCRAAEAPGVSLHLQFHHFDELLQAVRHVSLPGAWVHSPSANTDGTWENRALLAPRVHLMTPKNTDFCISSVPGGNEVNHGKYSILPNPPRYETNHHTLQSPTKGGWPVHRLETVLQRQNPRFRGAVKRDTLTAADFKRD